MKVSDYIIQYFEKLGIKDVFLLSGGGMMHLLDSVGRSNKMNKYYNLNEQATTMCADGYAQYTNRMSLCMVTTGPGSTNAVTGVASAYQDSTPMLILSGQVKTSDFASTRNVRTYGPQEINIVDMVKSITKYAAMVTNKNEIKYHLDKAVYLANEGRRGPVWIDVPLDIQASEINVDELIGFKPALDNQDEITMDEIGLVYSYLNNAKKPLILFGHGIIASEVSRETRLLMNKLNIPALCTWRAKDLLEEKYDDFYGYPGALAPRYSNMILQNADLLIVVGSRLNSGITGFNEPNFAHNAKKIIVDIDNAEIEKLDMSIEKKICANAKCFILKMLEQVDKYKPEYSNLDWKLYCKSLKEKYPIIRERMNLESDLVYGYDFAEVLSRITREDDILVASPTGRVCAAINLGVQLKKRQKIVNPMGLGSMGYGLPTTIGACIAGNKKRTIVFEGDGSLQHNIQELQLINFYNLPIKLFVYNNGGYSSIYGMQSGNFRGQLAGCNTESGVSFPSLKKIADAYGLSYFCIKVKEELESIMKKVLEDSSPCICEVMGDIRFEEIPRTQTRINEDGSIVSSCLENLYPFE